MPEGQDLEDLEDLEDLPVREYLLGGSPGKVSRRGCGQQGRQEPI